MKSATKRNPILVVLGWAWVWFLMLVAAVIAGVVAAFIFVHFFGDAGFVLAAIVALAVALSPILMIRATRRRDAAIRAQEGIGFHKPPPG